MCSTGELNGLNVRLQDVAKDALLLSIMVADGVVVSVRDALPALTAFSEAVSLLDVIVNAFAATVSGSALPFVRPRLTFDGPLAIANGRHPVACAHMRAEGREFVANSTFLNDAASFGASCWMSGPQTAAVLSHALGAVVITGANMSGKTTYLKQVAVNAVLAHAGCFVAAEFASFRLLDRLFSRLGGVDDCANSSTFMTECRELADMLQHATKSSLCIIDELVRASCGCTVPHEVLRHRACFRAVPRPPAMASPLRLRLASISCLWGHSRSARRTRSASLTSERCTPARSTATCASSTDKMASSISRTSSPRHACFEALWLDAPCSAALLTPAPSQGSNIFNSHYGILLARTAGLPAALLDRAGAIVSVLESKQACASGSATEASVFSVAQRLLSVAQSPTDGEAALRDTLRALRAAATELPAERLAA